MTEETKLLPCPFCCGSAELHNPKDMPCMYIKCSNCGAATDYCGYQGLAIGKWNSRA